MKTIQDIENGYNIFFLPLRKGAFFTESHSEAETVNMPFILSMGAYEVRFEGGDYYANRPTLESEEVLLSYDLSNGKEFLLTVSDLIIGILLAGMENEAQMMPTEVYKKYCEDVFKREIEAHNLSGFDSLVGNIGGYVMSRYGKMETVKLIDNAISFADSPELRANSAIVCYDAFYEMLGDDESLMAKVRDNLMEIPGLNQIRPQIHQAIAYVDIACSAYFGQSYKHEYEKGIRPWISSDIIRTGMDALSKKGFDRSILLSVDEINAHRSNSLRMEILKLTGVEEMVMGGDGSEGSPFVLEAYRGFVESEYSILDASLNLEGVTEWKRRRQEKIEKEGRIYDCLAVDVRNGETMENRLYWFDITYCWNLKYPSED